MERVLGATIGRNQKEVPGTTKGESPDEFRFISFPKKPAAKNVLDYVVWAVDPPYVKNGGCVLEDDIITPDGARFHTLAFHGDTEQWQRQIEEGAAIRGALSAKIVGDKFVVSNGTVHSLSELKTSLAIDPPRTRRR